MLEETLDNTKIWNSNHIFKKGGLRIRTKTITPEWLDDKIQKLSRYDNIEYEKLEHPKGKTAPVEEYITKKDSIQTSDEPFTVPLLRLKGNNHPKKKKKVLLQTIHAYEWAAIDSIMRFAKDWGEEKIDANIMKNYDITAIPILSIDKFPTKYGSKNTMSDTRFETTIEEINAADLVIDMHEGSVKNQDILIKPQIYGKFAYKFLQSYKEPDKKIREGIQKQLKGALEKMNKQYKGDLLIFLRDIDQATLNIFNDLKDLDVFARKDYTGFSGWKAGRRGKPSYGIELFSDYGEIGERYILAATKMLAYPLTEVTTFLNRTFRKKQINKSRMQSSANGYRAINTILKAYL